MAALLGLGKHICFGQTSLTSALDRFYTPGSLASTLTEALNFRNVNSCADPTCGHGQLLLSAEAQWPKARFLGLDIDRRAVRKVQRHRPQWTVSVGDMMSPISLSRTQIVRHGNTCELLLTNPPFSMGVSKGVCRPGSSYRCSIAIAHILAAIELFQPTLGVGAIVPESLLYSDLDETARNELAIKWILEQVLSVPQSTFKGTSARSAVVMLRPRDGESTSPLVEPICTLLNLSADLVRGGLPVHKAVFPRKGGLPFIHTTDLVALASGTNKTKRVTSYCRGQIVGSVVLLPRVGIPSIEQISPLKFTGSVQLSDCVIGIRFKSHNSATDAAKVMCNKFESLVNLYRGTGARYVTVQRIVKWLAAVGIEPNITSVSTGKFLAGI